MSFDEKPHKTPDVKLAWEPHALMPETGGPAAIHVDAVRCTPDCEVDIVLPPQCCLALRTEPDGPLQANIDGQHVEYVLGSHEIQEKNRSWDCPDILLPRYRILSRLIDSKIGSHHHC